MKKLLLGLSLLGPAAAHAQYYEAAALGVGLASAAFKKKPQPATDYVTTVTYKGQQFQQKRTPPEKIKGKAAGEIAQVEQSLQAAWAKLQASETSEVWQDAQYFTLAQTIQRLQQLQPTWSVAAYEAESSFYRSQNYQRQQRGEQLARQRQRAQQDSAQRVRVALARRADSLSSLVYHRQQALQDSAHRATQHAIDLASPYRYVNAAELTMRKTPSATAPKWANVGKGSTVELLTAGPQWSKVKAGERQGYVQSQYLVASPGEVQPEYRDETMIRLTGPRYTSVSWEEDAPTLTHKAKPATHKTAAKATVPRRPAASAGPKAYYCASGNVVKYHNSPNCRGLNRCSASVLPISLRTAQQSMDPCKFCY